jgi:serine/threonine protein kinase
MNPSSSSEGETRSNSSEPLQGTDFTRFVDAPNMIDVFRLDVLLGRGGMGEVWRAHDTNLERDVALKLMRRELNENTEAVKRFLREARAVARLNHPNIVQIYTFGEINGALYFVMELVEGKTVTDEIRSNVRLSPEEAVAIALQSMEGLDYALNRGIIHRDVKPSNLMLRPDGLIKIADFGLAKIRAAESQMTAAGSTMGSPNYMSPEQARGEEADHRSDMYSLGITLYQMLTGELPFRADSPLSVLLKQIQEPLPEPEYLQEILDGRLLAIIKRMTAKQVDRRYGTYGQVAAELEEAVPGARSLLRSVGGLSPTSSYPTPLPAGGPPSSPPDSAGSPGVPANPTVATFPAPPPVPRIPQVETGSSIPSYHREGAPVGIERPVSASKPVGSGRTLWGIFGALLIVAGAVASAIFFRPSTPRKVEPVASNTPPTVVPSPTVSVTPAPTVWPTPEPALSPSPTPAPSPTPILIVVQNATPAMPRATPTPTITPEPTPQPQVTTILRGVMAPDRPAGAPIPVRDLEAQTAGSLPAQTQVQVVRATNLNDGTAGYIVLSAGRRYFVATANIRIVTQTGPSNGMPFPRNGGGPQRPRIRPGPQVVQLGAATDTAPSVPVYRDAAGQFELRVFPRGTEVTVLAVEGASFHVTLPDGRKAYVLRKSTSPQGTIPSP